MPIMLPFGPGILTGARRTMVGYVQTTRSMHVHDSALHNACARQTDLTLTAWTRIQINQSESLTSQTQGNGEDNRPSKCEPTCTTCTDQSKARAAQMSSRSIWRGEDVNKVWSTAQSSTTHSKLDCLNLTLQFTGLVGRHTGGHNGSRDTTSTAESGLGRDKDVGHVLRKAHRQVIGGLHAVQSSCIHSPCPHTEGEDAARSQSAPHRPS